MIEIYIGDDPLDYTKNTKCPGGPFFDFYDDSNYTEDLNKNNNSGRKVWNYGKEIWCNLQGRYTHIISDNNSREAGLYNSMSICSLGIFGTRYERTGRVPSQIDFAVSQY